MKVIQLQGVGWKPAQEAKNIKVGDNLMWNFGRIERVTKIFKETEKTITIETESVNSDYYKGKRTLYKNRVVCII